MNVNKKTSIITKLGVLAAIAVILVAIVHVPISLILPFPPFTFLSFLEYDPADIPILLGTFALGPVAGFILTLVVSILQWATVSGGGTVYGAIMHVIATGAYVIVAGLIYKKKRTKGRAICALILGTLTMTLIMVPANLVITPIFMGVERADVLALIWGIVGFNFLKAGVNSILTFLLYKRVSPILHK